MPPKAPNITHAEYEMLAALRYALRQFLRFSEEAAAKVGLTPQQHQALLAIKGFPQKHQVTIGDLAERLQLCHHSAVGLADRLAGARLIERRREGTDRRMVHLVLTRRGETILEKLSLAHKEQLRRVGPEITSFLSRLRGQ
jgi:DNA-binding MarR family transcriptional regulator